ncbi:MAG TPA: hypothetical protein VKO63_02280 [Chitinispirillaceae bacterium]|nr:hypothetical protein [Chitinispirillaceae bacterium]
MSANSRSFVHEAFVDELDFSTIKKLNTKFIPVSKRYLVKIRNAVAAIF